MGRMEVLTQMDTLTRLVGIQKCTVDNDQLVSYFFLNPDIIFINSECQEYMKALVYYNPYYPTHIFATVCLWITCKLFLDGN